MVRVGGRIVFVAWGLRLASIFTISVSADASLNLLNGAPSTSAVTDFAISHILERRLPLHELIDRRLVSHLRRCQVHLKWVGLEVLLHLWFRISTNLSICFLPPDSIYYCISTQSSQGSFCRVFLHFSTAL